MILWQSLHVEVNRHRGSVCVASRAALINTTLIGQKFDAMIKRAGAARKVATGEGGRRRASSPAAPGRRGEHRHRRASRENSVLVLIIFVVATEPFAATGEAFDQREGVRVATDEAGAVRCGRGRVVVPSVRVSTEGRCRSSPRSRWAASRYRRSWAGRSVRGVVVTRPRVIAATSCP